MIQQSTANIKEYPHLAMNYNCDLLIVKESIMSICDIALPNIKGSLEREIKTLQNGLASLYLSKEKESFRAYNEMTGIQLKMK